MLNQFKYCKINCLIVSLITTITLISGCSTSKYAQWADRDAYGAIYEGQGSALGANYDFDIAYNPVDCSGYLKEVEDETGSNVEVLTIEDALSVAFKNNRGFQTSKERLYSSALYLANNSRIWDSVLPAGGVNSTATVEHSDDGNNDETNKYISTEGNYSLSRRLVGGGLLTLGATMNIVTSFLGQSDTEIGSLVEGSFTQPLLRGAWRGLAYEQQYRLERDFLIDVFEFDRFRQTFAVDIIKQYYSVLTLKDVLENSRTNVKRLNLAYLQTKAMVTGGQLRRTQEDQAQQNLLSAQISFELKQLAYSQAVDNFKITLGLSISDELKLDYPGALQRLNATGPQPFPFEETIATSTSFKTDTILLRARANSRDAEKDVEIAADNFLPQLDLELAASSQRSEIDQSGSTRKLQSQSAKLKFNYNLDQTDNRDAYRNAMISHDRSKRNLSETEDIVTLNVRNSIRSLEQSKQSHLLQAKSVEIARRRTRLISIERKQGQASTRDVLEAEDALNSSLNGLTSSLVRYTIERFQFLASLGMLDVGFNGNLNERKTPFGYERLGERYPYLKSGEYDENLTAVAVSSNTENTNTTEDLIKESDLIKLISSEQ